MSAAPAPRNPRPRPSRAGGAARPASDVAQPVAIESFSFSTRAMGGTLRLHLGGSGDPALAERDAARLFRRVDRWAARITRHGADSELIHLNAADVVAVQVRATLAAALEAGLEAADVSEGLADITLLDARLAAEEANATVATPSLSRAGEWSLERQTRGRAIVSRPPGLRFDLDGVGKGWIADRALRLLGSWPSAVVDADGDLALRAAPGAYWEVAVDDPRAPGESLAILRLEAPAAALPAIWGVATSGTSVHRWPPGGERSGEGSDGLTGHSTAAARHHLIDPRNGRPAVTDLVQATVIASSALRAEALAKATVIAGSEAGLALLERARVGGAIVLTETDETLALPSTLPLLAA